MQKRALVFFSNKMEILLGELKGNLFSSFSSPFQRRIIVVPDEKLKAFLLYRFANDPELKIASGFEVLSFSQATAEILSSSDKEARIPSSLELALKIQEKIEYLLATRKNDDAMGPLVSYLEGGVDRLFALSEEISRNFLRYGIYGEAFLPIWQEKVGWQQFLWQELFSENSPLSYPAKELKSIPAIDCQVHLFCFPFIPKIYLSFFKKLHAKFYMLSPCQFFWADLCSDKEKVHLYRSLRKQNIKTKEFEDLDSYLREQNALLANMGRLGRKFLSLIENEEIESEEHYEEEEPKTLLQAVQKDLLLLNEGVDERSFTDRSIQVHACVSKQREIEALANALQEIWQSQTIQPKDILVLAPDISQYAPYIAEVFSQLKVDFTINDLPLCQTSAFSKALGLLLSLLKSRFNPVSVLKLFAFPPFLKKFDISLEDGKQISSWLENLGVQWGVDEEQKEFFVKGVKEKRGTWNESFETVIEKLILTSQTNAALGAANIEWSQAALFGKIIHLLRSLKEDLQILNEKELDFCNWVDYLECLSESYFSFSLKEDALYQELKKLSFRCSDLKMPLKFSVVDAVIHKILSQRSASLPSSNLQAISFGSIGQGMPSAKIICLLGMDEGAIPRKEKRDSLCEMKAYKQKDYLPSSADEDRQSFLESILCAKEYFLIFYTKLSKEDHKIQEPCLLVQELLSYLRKGYKTSESVVKDHPALSFDRRYFCKGDLQNHSEFDFDAARAYYSQEKKPIVSFLSDFYTESSFRKIEREKELVIDIKKLSSFAKNPMKFYVQESLGIYLDFEEDRESQEFSLSNLQKSKLKKASLGKPFSEIVEMAEQQKALPHGLFKEVSLFRLKEEVEDLASNADQFEINSDERMEVELSLLCESPTLLKSGKWLLPPLKVQMQEGSIFLTGTLKDLFPNGLLLHADNKLSEKIAAYPSFLIAHCHPFLESRIKKRLLFAKDGKIFDDSIHDPLFFLAKYLEYYLLSLENPSPLFPDWAEALLNGDIHKLKKDMTSSLSSWAHFKDSYIKWLFEGKTLPSADILCEKWTPVLQEVFSPLLKKEVRNESL